MNCSRGSMEREVAHLEALNPGSKCAYVHCQLTVSSLLRRAFGFKMCIGSRSAHGQLTVTESIRVQNVHRFTVS